MATGNINLSVLGNVFSAGKSYSDQVISTQEVDNTDGFINILEMSTTKGINNLANVKALCIYNKSNVCAEIEFAYQEWKDNSNTDDANSVDTGGGATVLRYSTMLLPAGEFIYLPNGRIVGYNASRSGANATSISNVAPDSNEYTVLDASGLNEALDASETGIDVDDCALYKKGDLLRVEDEIMEVTALSATDGNGTLTVIRGTHGSTKATHTDSQDVRLPFFNAYNNYNRYSVAQTNKNGAFKCMNFFGYGRTEDAICDGIVPGSVAIKFYTQAYQEVGLSGISANTNSGLSASTAYYFKIAVDGGSAYEVVFTTDSSNVNFGGKNGIIQKIQEILDAQYYTEGNLFEKSVSVGIVNGDIRFTSGSRLSTSAVALTAGTSGTANVDELFDGSNQIGRFPAVVESAVAPRLLDDTILDKTTYEEKPNVGIFMYDNGKGQLVGTGSGAINYETGAIDFTAYPNAEFVVSATYLSAHSGAPNVSTANGKNHLVSIGARSTNQKLNSTIQVIALN